LREGQDRRLLVLHPAEYPEGNLAGLCQCFGMPPRAFLGAGVDEPERREGAQSFGQGLYRTRGPSSRTKRSMIRFFDHPSATSWRTTLSNCIARGPLASVSLWCVVTQTSAASTPRAVRGLARAGRVISRTARKAVAATSASLSRAIRASCQTCTGAVQCPTPGCSRLIAPRVSALTLPGAQPDLRSPLLSKQHSTDPTASM
jgi:hypothetical protein